MFAYVGLGGLESYLPSVHGQLSPVWYPLGLRGQNRDRRAPRLALSRHLDRLPSLAQGIGHLILAVLTGLVVWGLWVGLDGHYPALPFLGTRVGFDVEVLESRPALGVHRGEDAGIGRPRPADRRAFLEVVLDALADRPRFSEGPDRTGHADGRRGHFGRCLPWCIRNGCRQSSREHSGRGCSGRPDRSPPAWSATPRPTSPWGST